MASDHGHVKRALPAQSEACREGYLACGRLPRLTFVQRSFGPHSQFHQGIETVGHIPEIQITVDHNALAVGASDDGFAETNVFDNGKEIRSADFSGIHGCYSSLRPQGQLRTAQPSFGSRSAMVF
jgi:hypothetical protein